MVGHETSASVISYIVEALGRHPDLQNKLREELQAAELLSSSGAPGQVKDPTYDDLMNGKTLKYLDAVVKEG